MSGELNYSFFVDLQDSFFTHYGSYLSPQQLKPNALIPFKEHPQLPVLVDILSRKNQHHALLQTEFSAKFYLSFLEALLLHLNHDFIPHPLNGAELIYLDLENLFFTPQAQKTVEKDFETLGQALDNTNKYLLLALTHADFLFAEHKKPEANILFAQLRKLMAHPKCRYLILSQANQPCPDDRFTFLKITAPSETDITTILKLHRSELENFHHILIPEELLTLAYSLAERYLSANDVLENTLLLLDSSAARTSASEKGEHTAQFKPVMNSGVITGVLSTWTQIPAPLLLINKFRFNEFIHNMQQRVFGQDIAVTLLGHELQQSQVRLQKNSAPFCSLLFAGPVHSGKKTTALALTKQLFKQLNLLYFAQLTSQPLQSLADIKLQRCTDQRQFQLKDVVHQTPYAIFMFENIEQAGAIVLDGLQEILSTGYLQDELGNQHNFRHAIIILSTSLGSHRLLELENLLAPEQDSHDIDLMQLVMNEQRQHASSVRHYSPQELADEIMPEITANLPESLCQYLHVVPFLKLDKSAIEKIIRLKLNLLSTMLQTRYGIELGYASEVIHYLTHDVMLRQEIDHAAMDVEKTLKQLYFVIEQAIFSQADSRIRPNKLFLQLNETGQLLRYDWMANTATETHHLSSIRPRD